MLLISCLALILLNTVYCEDCVLDNSSRQLNRERQLHHDLLRDYSSRCPPQNTTRVRIRFILKTFNYDSEEVVFTIYNWLLFQWLDERLMWEPSEFEGISETEFNSYLIWTPMLRHRTNYDTDYYGHEPFFRTRCSVKSSGHVSCVARMLMQTECNSNLTDWPFDLQSCTFEFGAYETGEDHVIFTFNSSRGISMLGAEYGAGWDIIDFEKGENATSQTQFYLRFIVERHGLGLEATIIVPFLVLSVLTISTLFLDIGNTRLGMTSFSLYGHFCFLRYFNLVIPKHGATTPSVLRFMTGSLTLTSIAFVLSFGLNLLLRKSVPTPRWVYIVNESVFTSPGRFLIWPRWNSTKSDTSDDVQNKAFRDWTDFANVINSVYIVIAIIVYVSTFLAYIPHKLPYDYDAL